jgi:hypothetical protein
MATSRISTEPTEMPHGAVRLLALGQQRRQHRHADHLAQRRLGDPVDRLAVVRDGQRSFLGIVHVPEDDGVDVDRDRVPGQRLFRVEGRRLDAHVDDGDHVVDDGHDGEQAGTLDAVQFPQPQYDEFLPRVRHLQRERDQHGQDDERQSQPRLDPPGQDDADAEADRDQECGDRVHDVSDASVPSHGAWPA